MTVGGLAKWGAPAAAEEESVLQSVCVCGARRGADRVYIWSKQGCGQRAIIKDISHYQQRQMTWVSYFMPVFAHVHNLSTRQPFVSTSLHRDPLFTRPVLNRLTSAETSYFQAAKTYPGPQRQRRQDGKNIYREIHFFVQKMDFNTAEINLPSCIW